MKYMVLGCDSNGEATEVLGTTDKVSEYEGVLGDAGNPKYELTTRLVPCADYIMQGKAREMLVLVEVETDLNFVAWYEIPGT